jgi:hypothetical protein
MMLHKQEEAVAEVKWNEKERAKNYKTNRALKMHAISIDHGNKNSHYDRRF